MIEIVDEQYNVEQPFYLEKLEKITQQLNLNGAITIKLGDLEEAKQLNMEYLKRDYSADVLSFPFNEELPEGGFYIGDIFVCYPVAEQQSKENEVSLEEELFTLMVHGILHLAGYDHEAETDEGAMLKLQDELVETYFHVKTTQE